MSKAAQSSDCQSPFGQSMELALTNGSIEHPVSADKSDESAISSDKHSRFRSTAASAKLKFNQYFDVAVVCVVIVVVWVLLALPTVFYHLPEVCAMGYACAHNYVVFFSCCCPLVVLYWNVLYWRIITHAR